jgi:hypothetical protein
MMTATRLTDLGICKSTFGFPIQSGKGFSIEQNGGFWVKECQVFTDIDYSSCRYRSLAKGVAAGQIVNIVLSDLKPDESGKQSAATSGFAEFSLSDL